MRIGQAIMVNGHGIGTSQRNLQLLLPMKLVIFRMELLILLRFMLSQINRKIASHIMFPRMKLVLALFPKLQQRLR